MNLYIDYQNISSFVSQPKDELFHDCVRAMKNQLDVFFNFDKQSIAKENEIIALLKFFTSGTGTKSKHTFNETIFPDRPLKSNSYSKFSKEQLSSAYLIDDERINVLLDKGAILIGQPGEEMDIFRKIFLYNADYKFERKFKIGGSDFNSWKDIKALALSTTDILIIDSFILSDPSLIESNLVPLIEAIVSVARCKVNIVIYTNVDKISISYRELSEIIRHKVSSVTSISPNITLIKVRDQRGVDSFAEHDRTIFTNYYRIYSGDSFNYFKSTGEKITKGREIHFCGFGDKDNHMLANELVEDLQKNIDSLPPDSVEGDKKSNFLVFKE